MKTRKTITATIYDSEQTVRLSIPENLANAPACAEISTGRKLCGWHTGRRWGIVHLYNIWLRSNGRGEVYGDEYVAYLLGDSRDRAAYDALTNDHNPHYYKY